MRVSFPVAKTSGNSLDEQEPRYTIKIDMEKLMKRLLVQSTGNPKHLLIDFKISGSKAWVKRTIEEGSEINGKPIKFSLVADCQDTIVVKRMKIKRSSKKVAKEKQRSEDYLDLANTIIAGDKVYTSKWYLYHIKRLYKKSYGHNSVELQNAPMGKMLSVIKVKLVDVLLSVGLKKSDVMKYLEWVFREKSDKLVLTLGLITSSSIISEFVARCALKKAKQFEVKYDFR